MSGGGGYDGSFADSLRLSLILDFARCLFLFPLSLLPPPPPPIALFSRSLALWL